MQLFLCLSCTLSCPTVSLLTHNSIFRLLRRPTPSRTLAPPHFMQGYAVVDGVFGPSIITQLQQELEAVYNQGLMHLNHTHLVAKGTTTLLPKSQIHEAELTLDPAIQRAAPLIAQLNVDRTLATMLTLQLPQLRLESQAIKMQHNEGVCVGGGGGVDGFGRRRKLLCEDA